MRIDVFQLVPGCVLLNDIIGKTNKVIIPKNTILTEEHITVIHKFLVKTIDVSEKLADGTLFQPDINRHPEENPTMESALPESFKYQYRKTVLVYEKLFKNWQNGAPFDIAHVRQLFIPLLEMTENMSQSVFTLYQQSEKDIFHRSVSLGVLSAFLARQMGYRKGEWVQAGLAGALCDCGLSKLDEGAENHPVYSYRMIEKAPVLTAAVKLAVLQHHERLDGSGYPLGLTGEKIHNFSRIAALCDEYLKAVFENDQPLSKFVESLQNERSAKFDESAVKMLAANLTKFSSSP
ncbi:HD-GYP domain, c-di-GMP phosphodiesterase class II (or its inactivated variant) [Lentibacillus persicus]|uniref:HD-GYP domain, c-di-GMP phosphodiesterase class II (Or its inactivated variant) n=1 Tax=Lentibacillus persicus TaxID=640948 RepID=A0A1I1ULJ5_9BACI|nr:HD domain-containing phosphohydrolase [Lentibacillus persicus]SFD71584.1 HD-GYP domain, c-di-GMP phosphodiesterase class II (or its inactivated variant) [Lentibacillus persicus]